MFENIGGKIKKLAKIICWIGIIISTISGIAIMAAGDRNGGGGALVGILTIIVGALCSWVGSFFTYGFGQLIENTDVIRENTRKQ